jgi:N-formylglutamate amidohydrolase
MILSTMNRARGRSALIEPELQPPFELLEPVSQTTPLLFNSPHSGSIYPKLFLSRSRLDAGTLRRSEDAFVDDLVGGVVEAGTPLFRARFPRAYLDVNREPYELDPRMFEGRLPGFANTRSLRVAGGLGTIARIVGDGHEIYAGKLPVEEALHRIENLYKPYHRTLRRILTRIQRRFGIAILVDCHSMPSSGLARDERPRVDIVLGDRYGTSCAPVIIDCVDETMRALGYSVGRNKPYAGGYITEHYGDPAGGVHVLQIEISRSIYMDERRLTPSAAYPRLQRDMVALRDALAALSLRQIEPLRQAAE